MGTPDNHADPVAGRRPARANGSSRGPRDEPAPAPGRPGTAPPANGAERTDQSASGPNATRPEASDEPVPLNGEGAVRRDRGAPDGAAPAADRVASNRSANGSASGADRADPTAIAGGAAAAGEGPSNDTRREPAGDPAGAGERATSRSRRPPAVTRDTARPEGGGRAAPGDAPAPARQWPLLTVLGLAALGLLIVGADPFEQAFRVGTMLVGVALLTGTVLRRVLPSVGMLAVRSRFTDMVTYGLLGTVIVLLALMVQPQPWLEIPFLEEAVRFTVR
ncbi:DUF3017 domain-containing protein [Streptomyces sp. WMMC940]|uniref:DUF3017 domain-containing protein n=1 Tax=Streptomyces sp. WMMC940 TaxID=3015153 RepID=UPI0022B74804|nr:DUF3017 domain-containing protein [Streptomyces sp. WMMC940]MCZ7458476.1 DUF3017 domain-containing protein [Streptomyces sp. WMMC940]